MLVTRCATQLCSALTLPAGRCWLVFRFASWYLQVRHGAAGKQLLAGLCQPTCPAGRPGDSGAVAGNASVGVHLAINLGNQEKGQAALYRLQELGTPPNEAQTVVAIPDRLRALADFLCRHDRMWAVEFGPQGVRNQPTSRDRNARDLRYVVSESLFPAIEIHCPGKRRQHDKLRKGEVRSLGNVDRSGEGLRAIAWQSEDERSQHVNPVTAEGLQAFDQAFACELKSL